MLLDLDEVELIEDIGCTPSEAGAVLDAIAAFTPANAGEGEVRHVYLSEDSDDDDDEEHDATHDEGGGRGGGGGSGTSVVESQVQAATQEKDADEEAAAYKAAAASAMSVARASVSAARKVSAGQCTIPSSYLAHCPPTSTHQCKIEHVIIIFLLRTRPVPSSRSTRDSPDISQDVEKERPAPLSCKKQSCCGPSVLNGDQRVFVESRWVWTET